MTPFATWTLILLVGLACYGLGFWIARELTLVPKEFADHELERRLRSWEGQGTLLAEYLDDPHVDVRTAPYDWQYEEDL